MLEQVCAHVHNYFTRTARPGTYAITNGTLTLDFLREGQRFHIVGSDLNDGVYTWHADGIKNDDDTAAATLADEEFAGTILPMAVPRAFIDLCAEIAAWVAQYGKNALSPYQSEDVIGVYSYTKAGASTAAGANGAAGTWESAFAARLNPYRRTGDLL